ncbi:AAA family ATPase [Thermochromatium tepidum]|uniref:AAA family ATPase n=1 Tax=Thermochromatium tepidum ATCC 43061 TaxID=316276 RepID=A0A6I6DXS5_THETI|nr:AAA family ATPase [Thermochromatium tepidum]QGU31565.1 AAA family ATPase [Thermochromatium tepidum ATCC 43061]
MYESFFGFQDKPFSLLPDPGFFYPSQIHRQALTLLEYSLYNQPGFTVITGEIGSGKTTLIRYLLGRLEQDMTVGLISCTQQPLGRLLDWICATFDIQASHDYVAQHRAFVDFLADQYAKGRKTLLIIDEAQNLGRDTLEEIRLLSNVNSERDILLQVLLLGQPELRDRLRQAGLEQFSQRISASYHLGRMSLEDSCRYVRHRLRSAGGRSDIFTPEACHAIFHYSRGIPRLINLICDTALVFAYGEGESRIDARFIDTFVRSDGAHLLFAIDGEQIEPLPEYRPILAEELEEEIRTFEEQQSRGLPPRTTRTEHTAVAPSPVPEKSPPPTETAAPRLQAPAEPHVSGTTLVGFDYARWSAAERLHALEDRAFEFRQSDRRQGWEIAAVAVGVLAGIGLVGWYILNSGPAPIASSTKQETHGLDASEPPLSPLAASPESISVSDADRAELSAPAGTESVSEVSRFDVLVSLAQEPSHPLAEAIVEAPGAEPLSKPESNADTAPAPDTLKTEVGASEIEMEPRVEAPALPEARSSVLGVSVEPATDSAGLSWLASELTALSIPVERLTPNHIRADFSRLIQFRDGSVALDEGARALLARFAERLKNAKHIRIHVVTHTDSRGLPSNNQVLSERRAADIALILRRNGIAASRLSHEGKGMSEPKFSREQEKQLGPWINRRVEIDLIDEPL